MPGAGGGEPLSQAQDAGTGVPSPRGFDLGMHHLKEKWPFSGLLGHPDVTRPHVQKCVCEAGSSGLPTSSPRWRLPRPVAGTPRGSWTRETPSSSGVCDDDPLHAASTRPPSAAGAPESSMQPEGCLLVTCDLQGGIDSKRS